MADDPILGDAARVFTPLSEIFRPRKRLTALEWCDKYSFVPEGIRTRPTTVFRPDPFQMAPLEDFCDPSVREITLMWGTQLGKTAMWTQLLAYVADQDPGPVLIVAATGDSTKRLSKMRIYPTLEGCTRTRDLLPPKRERHEFRINLQRMFCCFGWSGSVSSIGELSIRYLFFTELDKWSHDISHEADPEALAGERRKAFPNYKLIRESTPTLEGGSRIAHAYEQSDRRHFHVPCPHCGEHQILTIGTAEPGTPGIKWQHKADGHSDPLLAYNTAYYECGACHKRIGDEPKWGMLRRGRWAREGEHLTRDGEVQGVPAHPNDRHHGYQLSSLYSTSLTWGAIAEKWIESNASGLGTHQNFINSWLAETWKEGGDQPEWQHVRERLLNPGLVPYHCPDEAIRLTAGADIQENRIYYAVWAWGAHRTGWLLANGSVEHLPELKSVVLDVAFPRPGDKRPLQVLRMGIDARYQRSSEVYAFCAEIGPRAIPTMGQGNWRAPWTVGKPNEQGICVINLDTTGYKPEIYHALRTTHYDQPGTLNLHNRVSEDFVRQLCGEATRPHENRLGQTVPEWYVVDKTVGNHYLDATIIAYALGIDIIQPDIRHMALRVQADRKEKPKAPDWIGRDTKEQWL